MQNTKRHAAIPLILVTLSACTTATGVLQEGPATYVVSASGTSPAFTGTQDAMKKVNSEASAFCAHQGRQLDTISLQTGDQALGHPGQATLHFRCVEKAHP
jgi:hypothetical protein